MIIVLNHLVFFLFIPANGLDLMYPLRIYDSVFCAAWQTTVWVFSKFSPYTSNVISHALSCIIHCVRHKQAKSQFQKIFLVGGFLIYLSLVYSCPWIYSYFISKTYKLTKVQTQLFY